ncbi:MAG: exodeoxyribonuclease VII small subunit [Clostridia bacterium]|nr:exodeoxyribonuclease VII small subunit [Clostridia bacterium]
MTFEQNVKRLEEILEELESGKISLDEANKLFQEAISLSKKSYEMLSESKGKITVLKKEIESFVEKPYE